MIFAYINPEEVNGFSSEQLINYKSNIVDLRVRQHRKTFFDFPILDNNSSRYVYPITVQSQLYQKRQTILPKNHIFHIPDHVISDVKNNIAKIIFDYSNETFDCTKNNPNDLADYFIRNTMNFYGLEKNHVILLTGNVKPFTNVPYHVCTVELCSSHLPVASPSVLSKITDLIKAKTIRKYKSVALMRRLRNHRARFAYDIFSNNLKDDNLITFNILKTTEKEFQIFKNTCEYFQHKEFVNSLPWIYDDATLLKDALLKTPKEEQIYIDSYVNFAIETFIDSYGDKDFELDFSEKVYKPIARMQPFIVLGQPGILSYLKSAGYKTFDRWWDESYDLEPDSNIRYEKVFNLYKFINSKTKEELAEIINEMLPILEHNVNLYNFNKNNKVYLNNFKTLLNEIFDK